MEINMNTMTKRTESKDIRRRMKLEKIEYTTNSDDKKKFLQKWRNLAGFHGETDSDTGAAKLKRKIKGNDGKAYEDTLAIGPDGDHTIPRCLVDKDRKLKHKKTDRGRKRAVCVQNDDLDEYQCEYEYTRGNGDEKEEHTKAKRSKSKESLLPITADAKTDSEGFVAIERSIPKLERSARLDS